MQLVKGDRQKTREFPSCLVTKLSEHPKNSRTIAIVGDQPEALILSVLFAEAKIPNYLVGSFDQSTGEHDYRRGIEEALWLLSVHQKSGRIRLLPDPERLPFSEITDAIVTFHATNAHDSNRLEMTIRNLSVNLGKGSNLTFTGLCKPHYTSTVVRQTIEKHSGMRIGTDLGLYYLPLLWAGETIQAFKEKPKILAALGDSTSAHIQETLLPIFPSMSSAPRVEAAEAAGLFATVYREVIGALELELAKISENQGLDYDEVLTLCKNSGLNPLGRPNPTPGRDSIATTIALDAAGLKSTPQLIRAAKRINDDFQSQVLQMIKNGLAQCGRRLRRSRVAILGLDGLVRNTWSKPEPPQIVHALRRKGVYISVYPGVIQYRSWAGTFGSDVRVESSLLKAVADVNCAVVALPSPRVEEIDPKKLALEMSRPGAICDLTRVLEASNVEKAGLFYTSIGRGMLDR